jgi:hypothetical protein
MDRLDEFIALLQEILIALATQVIHKPMGVRPATVRHAKEGTRGAGNARFSKGTVNGLLSAVVALLGDLEERSSEEAERGKGMNETYHGEVAYEPQYAVIINVKRRI